MISCEFVTTSPKVIIVSVIEGVLTVSVMDDVETSDAPVAASISVDLTIVAVDGIFVVVAVTVVNAASAAVVGILVVATTVDGISVVVTDVDVTSDVVVAIE